MKKITSIENLQMTVSVTYGAVLKFGDHVLATDCNHKGRFTADVYEFIKTPEETGLGEIECRVSHIAHADETFPDNGHAIAWCMAQVAKG